MFSAGVVAGLPKFSLEHVFTFIRRKLGPLTAQTSFHNSYNSFKQVTSKKLYPIDFDNKEKSILSETVVVHLQIHGSNYLEGHELNF